MKGQKILGAEISLYTVVLFIQEKISVHQICAKFILALLPELEYSDFYIYSLETELSLPEMTT